MKKDYSGGRDDYEPFVWTDSEEVELGFFNDTRELVINGVPLATKLQV